MADLTNLKVGDTVHIDCGGSIVVPDNLNFYDNGVCFAGHCWSSDGKLLNTHLNSPFDIISITPKPEPKRIKGWLNIYDIDKQTFIRLSAAKDIADSRAVDDRIACIYIDVAEGEGL